MLRNKCFVSLALAACLGLIFNHSDAFAKCDSGSTPIPPVSPGGNTSAELWYTVNRADILYGGKNFKVVQDDYTDIKKRELKLKDKDHRAKIEKQLKDLCLLLSYNGDFNTVIRKMATAKLMSYSAKEMGVLVDAFDPDQKSIKIKDRNFRMGALIAFGLKKVSASQSHLEKLVNKSLDKEELAFAVESLLEINSAKALPLIKKRLIDKQVDLYAKNYIVLCLAKHLDKELTEEFQKNLNNKRLDINTRRCSLMALTLNGKVDMFETLKKAIDNRQEFAMRIDAVRLLAFDNNKNRARDHLVSLLKDRKKYTPEVRREACFALAQLGDASIKKDLYDTLTSKRHAEKDQRTLDGLAYACGLFCKTDDELKVIEKLLDKKVYASTTYFASIGLAMSKHKQASRLLLKHYKTNKNSLARQGMIFSLSLINDEASAQKIADVMNDRRAADLRLYAAYGIGYMKQKSTIPALTKGTKERDNVVRHAAVAAHGMFGEGVKDKMNDLKKISEKDRVDIVRLGAAFAYDVLSGETENLQTVNILSKLNPHNFQRRSMSGREILDKLNESYPTYHKTISGF